MLLRDVWFFVCCRLLRESGTAVLGCFAVVLVVTRHEFFVGLFQFRQLLSSINSRVDIHVLQAA